MSLCLPERFHCVKDVDKEKLGATSVPNITAQYPDLCCVLQVPARGAVHITERGHPEPPQPARVPRAVREGRSPGGGQRIPL